VNMTAEEYIAKGYTWEQIFTINTAEDNYYTTGTDITYSGSPAPVTSGALNATLASDNPVSKVVAASTAYNNVLKVTVTAGSQAASLTGVTVTKYGLLGNTDVSGVSVWDASMKRHGSILTSLTSDNKVAISFSGDPINVAAGASTSFTVSVNVGAGATTGTMQWGIASASDIASGGSVGGSFPIMGNTMSLTGGASSLGAFTVAAKAVGGAAANTAGGNVNIGDMAKEIGKFEFASSNNNEDLLIKQLVVYLEGSLIEGTDVKNFKLVDVGGNVLATAEKANDRYVTFVLASGYLVPKGTTKALSVKADVLDGSTRYFRTHVQNDYDMMVMGTGTGFYVLPTTFTDQTDAASGWFIVKQGQLTVTKSSDSTSGELSAGQTSVTLAKFDLKASGEKMEIRKMDLYINRGSAVKLTGTVKVQNAAGTETYLSISGTGVAGDATGLYADAADRYDLSQYLTLNSNETKTIMVVGDVGSTATSGSYTASVRNFYAKRFSTNDYADNIPSAATYTDGNALTVSASGLNVSKDTAVPSKNVSPGANGVVIGSYAFQATSAEDVRITTINLGWDGAQTGTPSTDLTNLSLWDGSTQLGTTIGTPTDAGTGASTESFSVNLVIPKSTTKIITVKASVASGVTALRNVITKFAIGAISGVGVQSGTSISSPAIAQTGQTMVYASGTLTITKDSSSAGSKILTAGLSGVELEKLNFSSLNENLTLSKLTLKVATGTSNNFGTIYLKDGSTTIGSTSLFGDDAVFTGLNVAIPADGTKVLGVFGDITGSGVMTPASTSSIAIKSDTQTTDMVVAKASGGYLAVGDINGAGTQSWFSGSNIFLFHNTAPTVARHASSPSGILTPSANQELFRFTVSAVGAREMKLASLGVKVSETGMVGGVLTTLELWDADLSQKIAASATTVSSTSANPTILFDQSNDIGDILDTYTISAGATKTFSVKANTADILTDVAAGNSARLTATVDGTTGFLVDDATNELDWANGGVAFKYTPVGGTVNVTPYVASDSYPVSGNTLTYSN